MNSIRVVIVEDEPITARNLAHLLKINDPNISLGPILDSVSASVDWFTLNPASYDLIFMDIRLADGLSFDIFKNVPLEKPVIFVTAYDDYAIQAFKNNGIDYILKPFDEQEISDAMDKFKRFFFSDKAELNPVRVRQLLELANQLSRTFRRSFLIHYKEKLIPIETAKIAWFYTANEIVYAKTTDSRQYVIEFTMEQLEQQIDPQMFFRANRQFIVNRLAISQVDFYFNGRLAVKVNPAPAEHILISKARATAFKNWMDR